MLSPARRSPQHDEPDVFQVPLEDEPLDSRYSEKEMRLLTTSAFASWPYPERPFIPMANVGLISRLLPSPIVPDVCLALDVSDANTAPDDNLRTFDVDAFGQPPLVAVEVVSNKKGNELGKLEDYARIGVRYVAIWDPDRHLASSARTGKGLHGVLGAFEMKSGTICEMPHELTSVDCARRAMTRRHGLWLPALGLGLVLWRGAYENLSAVWLRWCDHRGRILQTGEERAAVAEARTASAQARALAAEARAEQERARADRLAARLREMGIEID